MRVLQHRVLTAIADFATVRCMGRNNRRPDASIIRAAIVASESLEEAAERLNVHRTTLWRWLRDLRAEGEPIDIQRRLAA